MSSIIPFVDLAKQSRALKGQILAAIEAVIDDARYILGREVDEFEQAFARYCGAKYCVGVANGTDALHLALRGLGIGPGDEVITAGNSFAASAYAILYVGAEPVLVDVDPEDFNLDVELLEQAISPRTKAILPVHLYGQPARMDEIRRVANQFGLAIVEDAAQAHGARYRGERVGTFGLAGCFSFYPGKNLGAFGDGGAVVTNDPQLAEQLRLLRNYGQRVKNEHSQMGYNCRLDTVQAAVLLVKLRYLDQWNESRRQVAQWYHELLSTTHVLLPKARPEVEHIYHLFVIRHPDRQGLMQHLAQHGIQCGIHYPHPLHRAQPFSHARTVPEGLPVCSELAEQILSLPMFPELDLAAVQRIADAVTEFTTTGSYVSV